MGNPGGGGGGIDGGVTWLLTEKVSARIHSVKICFLFIIYNPPRLIDEILF